MKYVRGTIFLVYKYLLFDSWISCEFHLNVRHSSTNAIECIKCTEFNTERNKWNTISNCTLKMKYHPLVQFVICWCHNNNKDKHPFECELLVSVGGFSVIIKFYSMYLSMASKFAIWACIFFLFPFRWKFSIKWQHTIYTYITVFNFSRIIFHSDSVYLHLTLT